MDRVWGHLRSNNGATCISISGGSQSSGALDQCQSSAILLVWARQEAAFIHINEVPDLIVPFS
jgi:hypothetical protein